MAAGRCGMRCVERGLFVFDGEVESEVERRRRVGEYAKGDEVHAGFGRGWCRFEGDAAAGLVEGERALSAHFDGLFHLLGTHVVKEDVVDSFKFEEGGYLVEVVRFELDFNTGFFFFEFADAGL